MHTHAAPTRPPVPLGGAGRGRRRAPRQRQALHPARDARGPGPRPLLLGPPAAVPEVGGWFLFAARSRLCVSSVYQTLSSTYPPHLSRIQPRVLRRDVRGGGPRLPRAPLLGGGLLAAAGGHVPQRDARVARGARGAARHGRGGLPAHAGLHLRRARGAQRGKRGVRAGALGALRRGRAHRAVLQLPGLGRGGRHGLRHPHPRRRACIHAGGRVGVDTDLLG